MKVLSPLLLDELQPEDVAIQYHPLLFLILEILLQHVFQIQAGIHQLAIYTAYGTWEL